MSDPIHDNPEHDELLWTSLISIISIRREQLSGRPCMREAAARREVDSSRHKKLNRSMLLFIEEFCTATSSYSKCNTLLVGLHRRWWRFILVKKRKITQQIIDLLSFNYFATDLDENQVSLPKTPSEHGQRPEIVQLQIKNCLYSSSLLFDKWRELYTDNREGS